MIIVQFIIVNERKIIFNITQFMTTQYTLQVGYIYICSPEISYTNKRQKGQIHPILDYFSAFQRPKYPSTQVLAALYIQGPAFY